jgi:hypothetical protein
MSFAIGPASLSGGLDTLRYPLLAFLPGCGVYCPGLATVQGLLKLLFDVNTALAFAFLPDELTNVLTCRAVASSIKLLLHPPFEGGR